MSDNKDEIYSKSLRAGRRTYFFDVRSTRADDYYLTITESKRDFNEDGTPFTRNIKFTFTRRIFQNFKDHLNEMVEYIINERGEEVISLHKNENSPESIDKETKEEKSTDFTEVNFEDLGKEDE